MENGHTLNGQLERLTPPACPQSAQPLVKLPIRPCLDVGTGYGYVARQGISQVVILLCLDMTT